MRRLKSTSMLRRAVAPTTAIGLRALVIVSALLCPLSLYMWHRSYRIDDTLDWCANGRWFYAQSFCGRIFVWDMPLLFGNVAASGDPDLIQQLGGRIVRGMELRDLRVEHDRVVPLDSEGLARSRSDGKDWQLALSPFSRYVIIPRPAGAPAPEGVWRSPKMTSGRLNQIGVVDAWRDSPFKVVGLEWRFTSASPLGGTFWLRVRWPLLAALAAIPPIVWVARLVTRRFRVRSGCCPTCSYDLRATPDRCPECGAVPAAPAAR